MFYNVQLLRSEINDNQQMYKEDVNLFNNAVLKDYYLFILIFVRLACKIVLCKKDWRKILFNMYVHMDTTRKTLFTWIHFESFAKLKK